MSATSSFGMAEMMHGTSDKHAARSASDRADGAAVNRDHVGRGRDKCLRRSKSETAAAAGYEVNPVAQSKIYPAILPGS
jgi:hypothetical protein